jgi:hypothetical protein
MTKKELRHEIEQLGHNSSLWDLERIVEWVWERLDPKLKEE